MKKSRGANSRKYPEVRIPASYNFSGVISLASIKRSIEEKTGKPIIIEQGKHNSAEGCSGSLERHPEFDLVTHAPTLSQLHLQQLLLHEFAHIIQSETGLDEQLNGTILLDFSSAYSEEIEFHAEALADRMAELIRLSTPCPQIGLAASPLYGKATSWRSLLWS